MGATLVINASGVETRVALVENGTISEYYLERKKDKGIVGNIYKGKVVRVLPGMQAAFVDIGLDKAAFLYVNDVFYDPDFSEQQFELTEGEHAEYEEDESELEVSPAAEVEGKEGASGDEGVTIVAPALQGAAEPAEAGSAEAAPEEEPAAEGAQASGGERRGEIRSRNLRRRRGRLSRREVRPESAAQASEAQAAGGEAENPQTAPAAEAPASSVPSDAAAVRDSSMEVSPASAVGDEATHKTSEAGAAAEQAPVSGAAAGPASAEKASDGQSARETSSPVPAPEAPSAEEDVTPAAAAAGQESEAAKAAEVPVQELAAPAQEASDGSEETAAPEAAAAPQESADAPAADAAAVNGKPAEEQATPAPEQQRGSGRQHRHDRGRKGKGERNASPSESGKSERQEDEDPDSGVSSRGSRRRPTANIQDLLKVGQEIIVQVAKDPIGTKGARVTSHISIPGRQIVFMPTVDHVGISRRIEKESERRRLREIVERIRPAGTGFIVRTVAENISTEKLEADARFLIGIWSEVVAKKDKIGAPALLHPDLDLTLRATRDLFVQDVEKLVIDDRAEWERISRFVAAQAPALKDRVVLHEGDEPIFDAYGIEHELQRAYSRKVWLKSGGYLIIDQAEALTAIDVNSGRYVGKKSLEETITKINIEAAKEIVYQLRLRNIGGIMIIDFIDMAKAQNRDKVFKALQEALGHDKARTNILKISELGLIEMTRKRVRESVGRTLNEPCPYCEGRGFLKSRQTVAYDIFRQIRREAGNFTDCSIIVNCHPDVARIIQVDERDELRYLMDRFNKTIHIRPQPGYHQEQYEVYGKIERPQRGRNGDRRNGGANNGGGNEQHSARLTEAHPPLRKPEQSGGEMKPVSTPLEPPPGRLAEYTSDKPNGQKPSQN